MVYSNCHTHTVFCDGKNTPEEMLLAAIDKGFSCLGFSFHSPMTPLADWAIKEEDLPVYTAEIRRLQRLYGDKIEILHGIELDRDYCGVDVADYDYVIAAVHQLTKGDAHFDVDASPEILCQGRDALYGGDWLKLAADYYDRVADFTCRIRPTIVAHLDLIEKFNEDNALFDAGDPAYQALARGCVDKILAACPDVLFEVNTGAMYRCGKKQPYPAPFLLRHLYEQGAKVIVTADAHTTDALSFAFDKALEEIRKAGFHTVYELRLVDGKAVAVPQSLRDDTRVGDITRYLSDPQTNVTTVCVKQLWREALNELGKPSRSESDFIAAVMDNMPGWKRGEGQISSGEYRKQRFWEKTE